MAKESECEHCARVRERLDKTIDLSLKEAKRHVQALLTNGRSNSGEIASEYYSTLAMYLMAEVKPLAGRVDSKWLLNQQPWFKEFAGDDDGD